MVLSFDNVLYVINTQNNEKINLRMIRKLNLFLLLLSSLPPYYMFLLI